MAATSGKTIFGKETMFYPNALKYSKFLRFDVATNSMFRCFHSHPVKYVYQKEGFRGFYRGFGCSVMSTVLCFYTTSKVDEVIHLFCSSIDSNERDVFNRFHSFSRPSNKTQQTNRTKILGIHVSKK